MEVGESVPDNRDPGGGRSRPELSYDERMRLKDLEEGRRTGKSGIPAMRQFNALREADPSAWPTIAHLDALIRQAHLLWSHEQEWFRLDTGPAREQLARLGALADELRHAHNDARSQLDEASKRAAQPYTPEELEPRSPDEAALAPSALRARREATRQNTIRRIEIKIDEIANRRMESVAQQAQWRQAIHNHREAARARVERIAAHISERMATFWSGLVDKHHQGRQLSLLALPELDLPHWVLDEPATSPPMDNPFNPTQENGRWQ
jgi:hypothetical protein